MSSTTLFSIYDRKAQVYTHVFVMLTDADAVRSFTATVMDPQSVISQYPADFDLFRVGTIDLRDGILTPESQPFPLVNGLIALQTAHSERRRYEAMLAAQNAESSPEAS